MRTIIGIAAAVCVLLSTPAVAQALPGCNSPTRTVTGPNGKTLTLCLDGKYTTCVRDILRLGHTKAHAKRNCDEKRARGAVS